MGTVDQPPAGDGVKIGKRVIPRRKLVIGGVLIVGGILVVAYWRKATSNRQATVDPATGSIGGDGSYVNPVPGAVGNGGTLGDADVIKTHAQWTTEVLAMFGEQGIYDPVQAAVIMGKYMAGIALTTEEASVIRTAWAMNGHPTPDVPLVLVTTGSSPGTGNPNPPPASPAPVPKPPRRYVTTVAFVKSHPDWRSTLSGIASHTKRSVSQLATWNNIKDPNVIGTGVRIWVDPPGDYNGSTEYH